MSTPSSAFPDDPTIDAPEGGAPAVSSVPAGWPPSRPSLFGNAAHGGESRVRRPRFLEGLSPPEAVRPVFDTAGASTPRAPRFLDGASALAPATDERGHSTDARQVVPVSDPAAEADRALRSHLESQLRAQVQSQFDAQVRAAVDEAVARTRESVQRESEAQAQTRVQQALQAATEQFDAALAALAQDAARDALDLAIVLTRQLIDAELKQSPSALVGLARDVLQRLGEGRTVTVRLHPDDVAALKSDAARDALSALRIAQLKVQPDARLSRGDLIAETDAGRVEATIEGRLRRLHEALSAVREADATSLPPPGGRP